MKILVVEDNEDSRNLLVKQLRAYGHEVTATANGAEALEQALVQPPDIIVSDILMPKMDGYQLCHECKQNEQLKNIPFVFYTATYTLDEDKKFALSLGADAFLLKPTEPDILIQMLCDVCEKAKSGALALPEATPLEPSPYLTEYSKRIFAKLEHKVAQLEREITERKRAEERLEHLNRVLLAIRSVNQLIIREKDRDRLLKEACNNLIKTRGFYNAWIAILDESGRLVTYAEADLGEDFLPVVEQLRRGELPTCCQRALRQASVVAISDLLSTCGDCPLVKKLHGRGALVIRLEYEKKVYGLLVTSVPAEFAADEEEQSLFQEVAGDIAFALHDMELEEERKRLEHSLKKRVKELQCLYDIGNIAQRPGITLDELYQEVVNLLPEGWQYPEITCAKITISDKEFRTNNYRDTEWKQSSDIKIGGTKAGVVEVGYLEERSEIDEGPFLKEERLLIDAVAERLGRIAERKRMEEKTREVETLKEIDRLRSGLLANVSHELRTPLTSIKGFASTLLDPEVKWSEEEQRDFLQTIDHESDRLTRLISDLLDMSRLEASALKLERDKYQVSKILDSISDRLANLTEHHRLKVIAPAELPPVSVDQMRIGQVLINLVENATKFSPEGSEITVEAQLAGDQINVSVTDRGQGIAPELLDKVFDRFYQAESIVTGRKSGTGLGLSICRGIIEAHGGRIWVESKVGEGSKFSFSLPVDKGKKESA